MTERLRVLDTLLARIMAIEGAPDRDELTLLYRLAAESRHGVIVEVGSARGRSTVALALGSKAGSRSPVYAIEPHEHFRGVMGGRFTPDFRGLFFSNLLETETSDVVRLVNLSSEVVAPAWPHEVGLIFIDGDHTYEGVRRDCDCWLPHLLPGGLMVFHDSLDERMGVHLVIDEALKSGMLRRLKVVSSTTVLEKTVDRA